VRLRRLRQRGLVLREDTGKTFSSSWSERLQRLGEIRRRRVTIFGTLLERLREHVSEPRRKGFSWYTRIEMERRLRDVVLNVLHRRARFEWQLARQHLVQDDRERVDVAPRIEGFTLCLFGRHELRRAENHAFLRQHHRAGT